MARLKIRKKRHWWQVGLYCQRDGERYMIHWVEYRSITKALCRVLINRDNWAKIWKYEFAS